MALAGLMANDASAAKTKVGNPLAPKRPHHEAKAKRVIYLHMTGSPPKVFLSATCASRSQLDPGKTITAVFMGDSFLRSVLKVRLQSRCRSFR